MPGQVRLCLALAAAALVLLAPGRGWAAGEETGGGHGGGHVHVHSGDPVPSPAAPGGETPGNAGSGEVGLDERLGALVPADLEFADENGRRVSLGEYFDRPILLQLVFYHCPQSCSLMMAGLANALGGVTLNPGKDFRVLTLSFDPGDTPAIAGQTRTNYLKILGPDFPGEAWTFLTGGPGEIQAVTRAVGFRFRQKAEHDFIHPNVLIALGPGGKVIRYLYGVSYLPFDLGMALGEAARGTPSISIRKLMTYCFDYDPGERRYVFRTFRVMGSAVLLALAVFLIFLLKKGPRRGGGD
jgi:protein SCO1/2